MDYFQGVVTEYLRAKRSVFLNPECLLSLDEGKQLKGRHWYCDVVAVDFKEKAVSLCEITYSTTAQSLLGRLCAWRESWPELVHAVRRDCGVPEGWTVRPWIFLPEKYETKFSERYALLCGSQKSKSAMPEPRVTHLESTVPWKYLVTWDRKLDDIASGA